MARILTSGFEEALANTDLARTMWNSSSTTVVPVTSPVHGAGSSSLKCPDVGTAAYVTRTLAALKTSGSLWTRVYVQWASFGVAQNLQGSMIRWVDGANAALITVRFNASTKKFRLDNGVATVTADGTYTGYVTGKWYRIEFGFDISASATATLKIYDTDSATPLDTITISATNTAPVSPAGYNSIEMGNRSPSGWGDIYLDDVAVNDETTAALDNQTSWCGPGAIFTLFPNGNNSVGWTPTGAASNYLCVDDVPGTPDDSTTYNSTTGVSAVDRLETTALPVAAPAGGYKVMDIYGRFSGTGATAGSFQWSYWIKGVHTDGPAASVTVTSATWRQCATNEHLTADLTGYSLTDINGMQIGYTATLGSGITKRITAMWANVEYVPGAAFPVSNTAQSPYVANKQITQTKVSPYIALLKLLPTKLSNYEFTSKSVAAANTSNYENLGATSVSKSVISAYEALKRVTQQF